MRKIEWQILQLLAMGERSRENLNQNLTCEVSVKKYAEEILKL